jgi:hypothetical protein
MAPEPSKPWRRVCINSRRSFAYRDPRPRLGRLVLDRYTYRKNASGEPTVPRGEESGRALNALIARAQETIEQSRALIGKIDELLAKHR